jgi:RNA-directed DNA polymerase
MRDEDVLQPCGRDSRTEAAAGVDQVRAQADEPPLDAHRHRLVERLKPQRYRATRGRRHAMPTGEGTPRPLGLPAVEDTRLPRAVARLLDAIDAQDFRRGREGYRPPVGALEAVETLPLTLPCGR